MRERRGSDKGEIFIEEKRFNANVSVRPGAKGQI